MKMSIRNTIPKYIIPIIIWIGSIIAAIVFLVWLHLASVNNLPSGRLEIYNADNEIIHRYENVSQIRRNVDNDVTTVSFLLENGEEMIIQLPNNAIIIINDNKVSDIASSKRSSIVERYQHRK